MEVRDPREGKCRGLGGGWGWPGPQDDSEDRARGLRQWESISRDGQWLGTRETSYHCVNSFRERQLIGNQPSPVLLSISTGKEPHTLGLVSFPTLHLAFLLFLQLVEILSGFYLFICGCGDGGRVIINGLS